MKKLKSLFSIRKIVILILIAILVITVPTLNEPAMSETSAIVTMLCVDKDGEEIVASATVLAPGQDKEINQQVYTSKGKTLGDAIDLMSLALGKEMGFAQCDIMAVGDTICEDGILSVLDYLTRTKRVGRNAVLINFSGDIQEFSQAVVDLGKNKSLKLSDIINYDKRYILSQDSNIETFYLGYYSKISQGIIPKISLTKEEEENAISVSVSSESEGNSGGSESQSSSSGGGGEMYLVNDGTISVFKKGKRLLEIPPEKVKALNFILNNNQKGSITVDGVTDELYTDATIVSSIESKSAKKVKVDFVDGVPKCSLETKIRVIVDEVIESEPSEKQLVRNQNFLTDTLREKMEEKVKNDMWGVIEYCSENNVDLLEIFKYFYRLKNKEWEALIDRVGVDNYLSAVEYDVRVEITGDY